MPQTHLTVKGGEDLTCPGDEFVMEEIVPCQFACSVTDTDLPHLRRFSRLRKLSLRALDITDAGVQHLAVLTPLEMLQLADTRITGAAMKHVARLVNLTFLSVGQTSVDDAGLAELKTLVGLLSLHLYSTKVSDSGLAHLRKLNPKLTELRLDGLKLTNHGLQHPQEALTNLTVLGVRGTGINDIALAVLGQMKQLQSLDVSENQGVTATGLNKYLKGLSDLKRLVTRNTGITTVQRAHFDAEYKKTWGRVLLS
jgi:Leucine-rich repeat (LRR) protein